LIVELAAGRQAGGSVTFNKKPGTPWWTAAGLSQENHMSCPDDYNDPGPAGKDSDPPVDGHSPTRQGAQDGDLSPAGSDVTASPSRPPEGLTRDGGEIAVMKRGAFDYGALNHLSAKAARDAAERIHAHMASMRKDAIEIGRELLHVKNKLLAHGEFGAWLQAEFEWTQRTAENYMAAAELVAKNEKFSYLPMTTISKLASRGTPDIARDTIITRLDKGERPSTKEVTDEIAQRRHEQAEADRLASMSPEARRRERREREKRERQWEAQRLKQEEQERVETEAALQAVAILRDRLDGEHFMEFANLFKLSSAWRFANELRKDLEEAATQARAAPAAPVVPAETDKAVSAPPMASDAAPGDDLIPDFLRRDPIKVEPHANAGSLADLEA
jgi:hypothetical protein